MRHYTMVSSIGVLVLVGAVAAPALASEQIRVIYKGEGSAEAVCTSIVHDSVADLRRAFRQGRTQRLERSHLLYECNDLALDDFAFTMNADSVSTYLAPLFGNEGHVTVEQVGSTQE